MTPALCAEVVHRAGEAGKAGVTDGGQRVAGPVEPSPPETGAAAWRVTGIDNTWPVTLDRLAVDPVAGAVVASGDFADWPLLARLSHLARLAALGDRRRPCLQP